MEYILHSFKKKRKNKFPCLKIDMSQAYDRMERNFVIETLKSLGFHEDFNKIVMECISLVSFSILLNGSPFENFYPSRGLRKGDPLFPYLFNIGMEVLSQLLVHVENKDV